jgi:hypothetical protein
VTASAVIATIGTPIDLFDQACESSRSLRDVQIHQDQVDQNLCP